MPRRKQPNIWAYIAVFGLLAILAGAFIYSGSAYAGGWEVTNSISRTTIGSESFTISGLHSYNIDTDGSFQAWVDQNNPPKPYNEYYDVATGTVMNPAKFDNPEIKIKTSYPFYIKAIGTEWVVSDTPVLYDTYIREYSETNQQVYNHYTFGFDITFQTDAEKYYKPQGPYADYGFYYEDNVMDLLARVNFKINPWEATGTDGDWNIVDGWAGIMSASVVGLKFGIVEIDPTENKGHTIEPDQSIGDALNMYGGQPLSFQDTAALKNVPQSIDIECGGKIGAGAKYTADWFQHWDSIAIRNVYFQYRIRVDVMTTLEYELQAGKQIGQEPPTGDDTAYQPEITPWKNLLEWLEGAGDWFIPILGFVVIIVVVIFVVRPLLSIRRRSD